MSIVSYDSENTRFYKGRSMYGTFYLGDCLIFTDVKKEEICIGDVIIFHVRQNLPDEEVWVHRVVDIRQGRFITRGDNNPYNDYGLLVGKDIIGRVTHVLRNGRAYKVVGGWRGIMKSTFTHACHPLRNLIRYFLGRYYRWLKSSQLISFLFRPNICKLGVMTDKGLLVKYLYRGRTVACWWKKQKRFDVVRPFDMVISCPEELQ